MKKTIFSFLLLFLVFCLSSCASNSIVNYYDEWLSPSDVTADCYLKEGEEPIVFYSADLDSDIYFLKSNYYWILGHAGYNGPGDSDLSKQVSNLCKEKGAAIGLYSYRYTDTRYGAYTVGNFINTYSIKRYDYDIYLLVPMPDYLTLYYSRIGLSCRDMDSSEKLAHHRNTGAYVSVVFETSPAYYANISRGDIITSVNGQNVLNSNSLNAIFDNYTSSDEIVVTFLRNGVEYSVILRPQF